MTKEQKQLYTEKLSAKAIAYAENALSDIKCLMPQDEYEAAFKDFVQTFISGADAAVATVNEVINTK